MESLTKEQLGDIFDIVNSTYLGMKGEKKRITKKACKLWKSDNNLYKFLIALYNSEEINEKIRAPIDQLIDDGDCPCDWETQKVSWKTHNGRINDLNQSIERLEQQIEDVESGKGYISEETHKEKMSLQLKEQQEIIRGQGDTIAKLRNLEEGLRHTIECQSQKYNDQKKYYEEQIQKLV
mgnify:FL=1